MDIGTVRVSNKVLCNREPVTKIDSRIINVHSTNL
jgi:hypothetical protein